MNALMTLGLFVTLALPVVVPGGYWLGLTWMALLGGLGYPLRLLPDNERIYPLGRRGWTLAGTLLALVGVLLAMGIYHDEIWRVLPLLVPLCLALLALIALHTWLPKVTWFWASLALGGVLIGGWALWQRMEGMSRASGHEPLHPILFGNLGLLTGALCVAGLGWAWICRNRLWWSLMLLAGGAGGMLASMLSGTRGGWIALPLTLLVLHRGFGRWLPLWQQLMGWLGVIALLGALVAIPQTGMQQRLALAADEVQHYLVGERADTASVNLRLEVWQGTVQLITERPLLGHGESRYRQAMAALVEQDDLDARGGIFTHAHGDLLDGWVKRGLPGLGTILTLYLLPIWLFSRGLNHTDPAHRALAVAGLLLPVAFLDFGLSYSFLAYAAGMVVYSTWLVVIWSFFRHAPLRPTA